MSVAIRLSERPRCLWSTLTHQPRGGPPWHLGTEQIQATWRRGQQAAKRPPNTPQSSMESGLLCQSQPVSAFGRARTEQLSHL